MKKKQIIGWLAVSISLFFSLMWTYWGMLENFHEGWYSPSLWENLFIFLIQYIPFMLVFMLVPLAAMRWKRIGLLLFIALAVFVIFFFSGASFDVVYLMLALPLVLLGLMFYFGDAQPCLWAQRLLIFPPLILVIAIGIPNIIKIQARLNDGDFGACLIDCQGKPLIWAARGAGFPEHGVTWQDAQDACVHLSADGSQLMADAQNIWRLPSIEEAVRCQMLHGENAGGVWDAAKRTAVYEKTPDKETPLWDSFSPIIYYWTSELSKNADRAYIIDYKGGIFEKDALHAPGYRTFRCVKEP